MFQLDVVTQLLTFLLFSISKIENSAFMKGKKKLPTLWKVISIASGGPWKLEERISIAVSLWRLDPLKSVGKFDFWGGKTGLVGVDCCRYQAYVHTINKMHSQLCSGTAASQHGKAKSLHPWQEMFVPPQSSHIQTAHSNLWPQLTPGLVWTAAAPGSKAARYHPNLFVWQQNGRACSFLLFNLLVCITSGCNSSTLM